MSLSTTLRIPSSTASGSYWVIAKADWQGTVNENVETNNTRASSVIKIGPDMLVTALTAPSTAAAGGTIGRLRHHEEPGRRQCRRVDHALLLVGEYALDASDEVIGSRTVSPLAPDASTSVTTTLTVPATAPTGTYFVIAVADAAGQVQESTESNNTRASGAIKVGPDLNVSAMTAPATAAAGGTDLGHRHHEESRSGHSSGVVHWFLPVGERQLRACG